MNFNQLLKSEYIKVMKSHIAAREEGLVTQEHVWTVHRAMNEEFEPYNMNKETLTVQQFLDEAMPGRRV